MKKVNNKAFTLLEILAAVAMLSVLLLIVGISVSKYIENSKIKTYNSFKENLRTSANNLMIDCMTNNEDGCVIPSYYNDLKITYDELINKGYSDKLKDPEGPGYCDESYVIVKNKSATGLELEYNVCLYCDKKELVEEGCIN